MRTLVTGGAGYIGAFAVDALCRHGHDVVVFDSLSNGHPAAVGVPLLAGDLTDREAIFRAVESYRFDAVFHFASYISVSESVADPGKYFHNNVTGAINLLDACVAAKIPYLVFASSSEVYGDAVYLPLDEAHQLLPVNPYGLSKLTVESFLKWYDAAHGLRSISLRFFNAAGGALDGTMGEDHRPEEHLIPCAVRGALGLEPFRLTSAAVDTPDGTTIRDYVHVLDLVDAFLRSLAVLQEGQPTDQINVGTGRGYSTKDVIAAVQRITGCRFPVEPGEPRPGEPAAKYASNGKAREILGWQPEYDLDAIVASAVAWHRSHPAGYADSDETDLSMRPSLISKGE